MTESPFKPEIICGKVQGTCPPALQLLLPPFKELLKIKDNLPGTILIAVAAKMPGMLGISGLGREGKWMDLADLYRLAPLMMSLMCRYEADKQNFQLLDKF